VGCPKAGKGFVESKNKYGHFKDLPAHRKNYSPLDDGDNDSTLIDVKICIYKKGEEQNYKITG
jgi:hypothetical protein